LGGLRGYNKWRTGLVETKTKLRETVIKRIMKMSVGQMTTALRSIIAHSQKSVRHEQLVTSRQETVIKKIMKNSVGQMTTALRSVITHSQKSVRHEQLMKSHREKVFKRLANTTTSQQVLTFKV
jgi:hypothetical protein